MDLQPHNKYSKNFIPQIRYLNIIIVHKIFNFKITETLKKLLCLLISQCEAVTKLL